MVHLDDEDLDPCNDYQNAINQQAQDNLDEEENAYKSISRLGDSEDNMVSEDKIEQIGYID